MKISSIMNFNDFYQKHLNTTLNIQIAYQLNKIMSSVEDDIEFYRTHLNEIFEDCVEKTEDDKFKIENDNFVIKPDKIQEFQKRFSDLQNVDVNFDESYKINVADLGVLDITLAEMAALQPFLK